MDDRKLLMRMSIGAGDIQLIHLGEDTRRRHLLPAGKAVEQTASLIACADSDEILVSAEAWSLIDGQCEAEPHRDGAMRLLGVSFGPASKTAHKGSSRNAARDLSGYLPRALRASLNASWPGWVGELRVATIGFLRLPLAKPRWPWPISTTWSWRLGEGSTPTTERSSRPAESIRARIALRFRVARWRPRAHRSACHPGDDENRTGVRQRKSERLGRSGNGSSPLRASRSGTSPAIFRGWRSRLSCLAHVERRCRSDFR